MCLFLSAREDWLFLSIFMSFFLFFHPIPSYPSMCATSSIQPQCYPLDCKLLFLRAHPARALREQSFFSLLNSNNLSFSIFHILPSDSLLLCFFVDTTCCACTPRSFPPSSASLSFCFSPHPPSQSLDLCFLFNH